jgi:hypothetical protein
MIQVDFCRFIPLAKDVANTTNNVGQNPQVAQYINTVFVPLRIGKTFRFLNSKTSYIIDLEIICY